MLGIAWLLLVPRAFAQSAGCTAPDLDAAIKRVDDLQGTPTDAELATIATALVDGIDTLEKRLGGCSERLAEAHVYLALVHAWLPAADTMGLTEQTARRLRSISVSAQFEHALHLHPETAQLAMRRVSGTLARLQSPVRDLITVEFENAVTALQAAALARMQRSGGVSTGAAAPISDEALRRWMEEEARRTMEESTRRVAHSADESASRLALAAGVFYGHPTESNTRGATVGPYVFVGVRVHDRVGLGIAAGAATHGGFAPAGALGIRYQFARRAGVFLGYGTRIGVESVKARSGIAIGIDWSVFGR